MKAGRDRTYQGVVSAHSRGNLPRNSVKSKYKYTHRNTHTYTRRRSIASAFCIRYVVMHLKFHLNSECQNRREKILVKNMTLIMHTGCCFDSKLKCNKIKYHVCQFRLVHVYPYAYVCACMCVSVCVTTTLVNSLSLSLWQSISSACRFIEFSIIFKIWLSVAGFVWLLQEMKLKRCWNFVVIGHWIKYIFKALWQHVFLNLGDLFQNQSFKLYSICIKVNVN